MANRWLMSIGSLSFLSDTGRGRMTTKVRRGGARAVPCRATHDGRMRILSIVHVTLACAFYRWAMGQIPPLHPDLPRILIKWQEMEEREQQLWA